MTSKSLSVIIPAFNEEKNIRATCEEVIRAVERNVADYEILVIDDASQDRTAEIVRGLQKQNAKILLIQNPINRGLGYNYRIGVSKARCQYSIMVPGDNEMVGEALENIFMQMGSTDAIICYSSNPEVRPHWRQFISKMFTGLLNILFGLKIRYYNGPSVIRTDMAKEYAPFTSSFAYMAVILVQLLKSDASYKEMTFTLRAREHGKTKAFRIKNVLSVMKGIVNLYWKVGIRRQFKRILVTPATAEPK